MNSIQIYSDKTAFTLNWLDEGDIALGVIDAAKFAINKTETEFGDDACKQDGAVEHLVKVPELGMVYLVVSSNTETQKFTVDATRNHSLMMAHYEKLKSAMGF